MDEQRFEDLYKQYSYMIPLYMKTRTLYSNRDRSNDQCNKNQIMAVMIIGKSKGITPTKLSKFINMEKGSLTTLIDSLEEKGLAVRGEDPNDRRKTLLSLTPQGEACMVAVDEQSKSVLRAMIANLDESEINELYESSKSLVSIFNKIVERAK